jgi:hypothetical protein
MRTFRPDAEQNQSEEWPSSLLLVAKRIDTTKTKTITGTTKNGEVMSMAQAPDYYSIKAGLRQPAFADL